MWYTDLITYDEETGKWTVERYPSITTVTWFNNVAYELKLPVWISKNNFFVKLKFRNLLGSVSEFTYRLPSEIKWFSFKDNRDLAKLISSLSLRPHRERTHYYYRKWKKSVPRGYRIQLDRWTEIPLRSVLGYRVGESDYVVYSIFGRREAYSQNLARFESLWITRFLQERSLSPKLKHLIALLYKVEDVSLHENRFAIDLAKHKIYIEINNIANLTVYEKRQNYWGGINLIEVWSGFALTERGLMRTLMQLCEKFK